MAIIEEPTQAERDAWAAWVAERPERVRAVAARFEPWRLYRMDNPAGHRVVVSGFDEQPDGTVFLRVQVLGDFNLIAFNREVFGVDPDTVTECDLPGPDEELGEILKTQEERDIYIAKMREHIQATKNRS